MTQFSFKHFEYQNIIEHYYTLFGQQNVYVYLFEDFAANNHQFLEAFCSQFEFNIDLSDLEYDKVNPGYRTGIRKMARFTNRFTKMKMVNKHHFLHVPFWWELSKSLYKTLNKFQIFGSFPTTKQILGNNNFVLINKHYREANRLLLEKYGLSGIETYKYPI
jgi:hypothetical protein